MELKFGISSHNPASQGQQQGELYACDWICQKNLQSEVSLTKTAQATVTIAFLLRLK
jgi:hypothetical protein